MARGQGRRGALLSGGLMCPTKVFALASNHVALENILPAKAAVRLHTSARETY